MLRVLGCWGIVVVYTILLPFVIIPYRFLISHLERDTIRMIPLLLVISIGIFYMVAVFRTTTFKRFLKKVLITIVPSAIIVFFIIHLISNPNKHIHIPQYIFMTWLLYQALISHYRGNGLYLLIFFAASLLGIIDEIEQGLHPDRYYGWKDMLVNSASSFVGILTLIGLRPPPRSGPEWLSRMKKYRFGSLMIVFGIIISSLSCFYLYRVHLGLDFREAYPGWLVMGNTFYVLVAIAFFPVYFRKIRQACGKSSQNLSPDITPLIWNLTLSGILLFLNALVLLVAVSGLQFR